MFLKHILVQVYWNFQLIRFGQYIQNVFCVMGFNIIGLCLVKSVTLVQEIKSKFKKKQIHLASVD